MRKLLSLFTALLFVGSIWGARYDLVTDASTLSAGDVILFVSPAGSVKSSGKTYNYGAQAMTSTASGVRLGCSGVTITSNSITSTTAEEFTLSGNSTDGWKIYSGTKYLTATAKNQLTTTTTVGDALTFAISISSDKATISSTVGTDAVKLQMNATVSSGNVNTYFALYTGDQKEVRIFKKAPSVTISNPNHGTISVTAGGNAISNGDPVTVGTELSISVSGTGYTFTPRAYKTGDESTTLTITNNKVTMPTYSITITADEEIDANPVLNASVSELDWKRVAKGTELAYKEFTIDGANLTAGSLSLELLNDNFTVTPTSIDVEGALATTTIRVTPKSTANVDIFDDILMITGGGATELDIDLKLTVLEAYTVDWYINEVKKGTQTDTVGAELKNIPDATLTANGALSGKTFLGWTESAILTPTNSKPSISTPTVMTAANKEYRAVYATEVSPAVGEYRLVNAISAEKSYLFVSSNEEGSAYALPAKDMSTSQKATVTGIAVTISKVNDVVKIATLDSDLEYYCEQVMLGGGDTLALQIAEDNTNYLCINGSGMNKRTSGYKAFWNADNGLYGTSGTGASTYYINAGSSFSKLDAGVNPTNRVYAFEKVVVAAVYNAYVTKGYAVTIAAAENGTVTVKNGTTAITSGDIFANGTVLTVEAEPASGYQLASLTAGGEDISSTKSFTIGTADVEVVATFSQATAINNTEVEGKAVKVMRNGILYIEKNGVRYNAMGQLVK